MICSSSSPPTSTTSYVLIASLKRKLDRATRKKYEARDENFDEDKDIFGSDEDSSYITEASGKSTSVRNILKKKPSPLKKTRFKDSEE